MESSLYAQGILVELKNSTGFIGIIPVCTGNTASVLKIGKTLWNHPCMHREYVILSDQSLPQSESSLYAQGILNLFNHFNIYTWNHPCMHREYYAKAKKEIRESESSLYAQGIL